MEKCQAPKRKEILTHATVRMNPEDTLGEISRSQKDNNCMIPLTVCQIPEQSDSQRQEVEERLQWARVEGGKNEELNVKWVQSFIMEKYDGHKTM